MAIEKTFRETPFNGYNRDDVNAFVRKRDEEFKETEAYSQLFMKLATDADAAAKFVNGIIPAKLAERAKASLPPVN